MKPQSPTPRTPSRPRSPIPIALGLGISLGLLAWGWGYQGQAQENPGDAAPATEAIDPAPPEPEPPALELDLSDLPEPDIPAPPSAAPVPPPTAPQVLFNPRTSDPSAPPAVSLESSTGESTPLILTAPDGTSPSLLPGGTPDGGLMVLSERSTGCEATLQLGGDIPGTLCGYDGSGSPLGQDGLAGVAVSPLEGSGSGNWDDYYQRSTPPLARLGNGDRSLLFPFANLIPLTSAFGWRLHPLFGDWRLHTGADFGADHGTPVYAAISGQVTVADFLGGYGLTVVIQRDNQEQEVLYGHLSEIFVRSGDRITQGTPIGRVGSTGNSTGPHLHLELRQWTPQGWVAVDPQPYLGGTAGELIAAVDPVTGQPLDLQMLGAGFVDGPTPLEEAVSWFLDRLEKLNTIAQR